MKNNESYNLGKNEADIANLKESADEQDERLIVVEKYIALQKLTVAKCTAIWGFVIAIVTSIGGFIAYNFVKVKMAVIAAYEAFFNGH